MRDQVEELCDEIITVHSCMSKELFWQLRLTAEEERRAQLKKLLNDIDSMDGLIDCKELSFKKYRLACKAFFSSLEQLQLASLIVEKIQKTFGSEHFFLRVILPTIKEDLKGC